jgi:hypothetical protein
LPDPQIGAPAVFHTAAVTVFWTVG